MAATFINQRYNAELVVSDAQNFSITDAINPFMHEGDTVDISAAQAEHDAIIKNLKAAGATIHQVPSPENCQDGIYTANWALCLNGIALMAHLPYARRGEVEHAAQFYESQGFEVDWTARDNKILFSGQGGALRVPGTDLIFVENGYRTDARMNDIIAKRFNLRAIGLTAIPERTMFGYKNLHVGKPHVIIEKNGAPLPQSPGYDIDLTVGILGPKRIAYAPNLLTRRSRARIEQVIQQEGLQAITVSRNEALHAYGCNLVSVEGEDGIWRVVVNKGATDLIAAINAYDNMQAIPTANDVIKAGGGGFRCISNILNDRTEGSSVVQ